MGRTCYESRIIGQLSGHLVYSRLLDSGPTKPYDMEGSRAPVEDVASMVSIKSAPPLDLRVLAHITSNILQFGSDLATRNFAVLLTYLLKPLITADQHDLSPLR